MRDYYDMYTSDLTNELLGHKITAINRSNNSLILDDGTVLKFKDAGECCSWWAVDNIDEIDLEDNIVTDVIRWPGENEAFTLNILSRDKKIAAISVIGTAGTGYYCHSVRLLVYPPKEENK